MFMLKKTALAACLVLCTAPAMAQSTAEIQKLADGWTAAFNKGDTAAVSAMYAEDAYVLPDHGAMVHGRPAIEELWKTEIKQVGDITLKVVDVLPLGPDAAREIGTYTLKTKSQPQKDGSGKYAVVWRKIGGKWLLATDIWNEDK
jgi:uncharacterized protein (TIGR02246 family)